MNPKILIVDDSAFSRRSVRVVVESLGYPVEEAQDGAQALERFYMSPPDLVILDLVMPNMTGNEVLAKMSELNPAVPVIIATSDVQKSVAEEVRKAGAKALINKPINRDLLEATVKTVLAGGNTWT